MTTRVLLVEDDNEQATLFAQALKITGYTVEIVAGAEEAQVRLAAEPYTLLLADWDLDGGMNGDALILWAKAQCPGIKTILFSNHPRVDAYAAICGADAAFRKIDGIDKLRTLVRSLAPLSADYA